MGSRSWHGVESIGAKEVSSGSEGATAAVGVVSLGSGSWNGDGSIGAVEAESWRSEGTTMRVGANSAPARDGSGSLVMCSTTAEVG